MYPILYRLQDQKLITGEERKVGKRLTRVYYHLEPAGVEYLDKIRKEYFSMCEGIEKVLNRSGQGLTKEVEE